MSGPDLTRRAFLTVGVRRAGVALTALASGFLVDAVWARLVRGWHLERPEYPRMVLGRYRIHHNVVGWIALVVGVVYQPWILVPFGVGMIVGHRIRDRLFWFVERVD